MSNVHPLFASALAQFEPKEPMDIPCRFKGDLAEHEASLRDHEPEAFDEYNDEHLKQLVPGALVEPLMKLLQTRRDVRLVRKVEALNKDKALAWLERDADAVYRACRELWRDL